MSYRVSVLSNQEILSLSKKINGMVGLRWHWVATQTYHDNLIIEKQCQRVRVKMLQKQDNHNKGNEHDLEF